MSMQYKQAFTYLAISDNWSLPSLLESNTWSWNKNQNYSLDYMNVTIGHKQFNHIGYSIYVFYLQKVFMYFIWLAQQTLFISLYSIKWDVSVLAKQLYLPRDT
jgi:hypothetical protein